MQTEVYQADLKTPEGKPAYITVQHCLISFSGAERSEALRSKEEAQQLAEDLFAKAQAGEDFGKMVQKYTDDSAPGIYKMANDGYESDNSSIVPSNHIYARSGMVPAFGDCGFALKAGEYALAPFDKVTSPFGWHIIKRIR
ncbi:MAG: peptidylprolyl isomerase [Pirellulaceae bacterium]